MINLRKKVRYYLGAVATIGIGLYVLLEYTGWQQLQAVTLNGEEVADCLGIDSTIHLLDLPLSDIANQLLDDKQTARVDMSFRFPHRLNVETNRFEPICLILEKDANQLCGITAQGRTVPLKPDFAKWDSPVITGAVKCRPYSISGDPRVVQLMPQLVRLADDNLNLFRLIDEIDLSQPDCATVTLSGLSFRLHISVDQFEEQIENFVRFMQKYQPDVTTTKLIDLRFANMVIQKAKRN